MKLFARRESSQKYYASGDKPSIECSKEVFCEVCYFLRVLASGYAVRRKLVASEVRTIRAKRYFAFISVASSQKPAESFVILISNVNSTNHRFDWLQNEKFYLHHSFQNKRIWNCNLNLNFTIENVQVFFLSPVFRVMQCKTKTLLLTEWVY